MPDPVTRQSAQPSAQQFPPAFQFSQSSLQDYADCARRFQLRYLMQQLWPAPLVEPLDDLEQAESLGKRFHRLMERYWLGMPIKREQIDPALVTWWESFTAHPLPDLPAQKRRPEVTTTATIAGQRFVGMFDLLAYSPDGDAVIVDWKTNKRRPTRAVLDRRLQTLLYPLLLVDSAPRLLGYAIKPEQVRMIYWFTAAPDQPEIFQYSTRRYEQDRQTITAMIGTITDQMSVNLPVWPLTPDVALCRYCQYRSLCERGVEAGTLDELDAAPDSSTGAASTATGDPSEDFADVDFYPDDYIL